MLPKAKVNSEQHAIQQTFFLHVYEPGGNRVEVASAGARLILAPGWKPIVWTEEERKKGQAWGAEDDRVVSYPWDTAGVRGQAANPQS